MPRFRRATPTESARIVLFALACMAARSAGPSFAQTPTIGLYTDASGSSCNFSGDAPGMVAAHVVVRPNGTGVTAVQFAAPVPVCFGATFLTDVSVPDVLVIGSSQSGVSIALLGCTNVPTHVLEISYMRTGGATAPCCAYPVVADPVVGEVVAADCAFQTIPAGRLTSRFNADGSCPCTGNSPPETPTSPLPVDGAVAVSAGLGRLSWQSFDVDGDSVEFDVYLGMSSPPPLAASALMAPSYSMPALAELTQHYWRVVARDEFGLETSGPEWTFTTKAGNSPPDAPTALSPTDGQNGVAAWSGLEWTSNDVDGDVLTFDVYLGTTNPPPLVATTMSTSYAFDPWLDFDTTYYWRIVARDRWGHEVSSSTWLFATTQENYPPAAPTATFPQDGVADIPVAGTTLQWSCSDPEGQAMTYHVHLGVTATPPRVESNTANTTFTTGPLLVDATYYWQVVARDVMGAETAGPVWTFSTRENTAPVVPFNPSPSDAASDVALATTLRWDCSDPQGDHIRYYVYLGTQPTPPLVAQQNLKSYVASRLVPVTTHYWRIVARDQFGAESSSPLWTFTTRANSSPAVCCPSPASGALVSQPLMLTWTPTDPDNQSMNYDLYLGLNNPPPLFDADLTTWAYSLPMLELQTTYYWQVVVRDPYGATVTSPVWTFSTNNVPVLITRFEAAAARGGVQVRWELQSDEAVEGYTLLRREDGHSLPVVIVRGPVDAPSQSYIDASVEGGKTYHYELLVRAVSGSEFRSQVATVTMRATTLALHQNHPNPFNPRTSIAYDLPSGAASERVRLVILDVSGRIVRKLVDENQAGGSYRVEWEGKDDRGEAVSSGVYIYLLDVGGERRSRKLVLLK
jgi:hypothetical protein